MGLCTITGPGQQRDVDGRRLCLQLTIFSGVLRTKR